MSSLCVFTSGNEDQLALLRRSCESVMIILRTFDNKWTDYVDVKIRGAIRFLNDVTEPYAMWVDGHDTLLLKPESDILDRLHAYGDPVLIAAEATCWPDADLSHKYPDRPRPRFLNAGGYIGNRHQVLTALHTVLMTAGSGDDQREWTRTYLAGRLPELQLDHARRIFSCVGDGPDALKADTCVMHWNGKTPGREEYYLNYACAGGTGMAKEFYK